jgi:hypothetical protein
MWMQILKAAGFPLVGVAFPRDWGEVLRDANREGFYESHLRDGIYHATNPHPRNGVFLAPRATRHMAVKVFVGGVVKSDLAYVDKVIASMRPLREYVASLTRLYDMERANRRQRGQRIDDTMLQAPDASALMWWDDNYSLLRDALIRGYPLHMISYASVLRAPGRAIGEVLDWLGRGDHAGATAVVQQTLWTQHANDTSPEPESGLSPALASLFDELYQRVDQRIALDGAFIGRLNDAHDALCPRIAEARKAHRQAWSRARAT